MQTPVQPSAATLTWGIVLLVIGGAVIQAGQSARLEAALSAWPRDDGSGQMLVGTIIGLVGLILTVVGVQRLASNVDVAARIAADRAQATQKRPEATPAAGRDALPPRRRKDPIQEIHEQQAEDR